MFSVYIWLFILTVFQFFLCTGVIFFYFQKRYALIARMEQTKDIINSYTFGIMYSIIPIIGPLMLLAINRKTLGWKWPTTKDWMNLDE